MKHWQYYVILLAIIIALPVEFILIAAMLPYIGAIGVALAILAITWCICLAIYGVALMYHKLVLMDIRRQREYFSRRYIAIGGIAVFHQEDNPRNLSAERLSAPMLLEEEQQDLSAVDQMVVDRSKVLTLHFEEHMGMHAIADELKIPYNRVRDWVNIAEALRDQEKRSW